MENNDADVSSKEGSGALEKTSESTTEKTDEEPASSAQSVANNVANAPTDNMEAVGSKPEAQPEEDDDLEEGELKDDDDDDDDDLDGSEEKEPSKSSSDESEDSNKGSDDASSKASSRSSSKLKSKAGSRSKSKSSSSSSSSLSSRSNSVNNLSISHDFNHKKRSAEARSSMSSASDNKFSQDSHNHRHSSRHGSSGRQSPRSLLSYRSSRLMSPISNQQAKLVSMRAKLLEARSREIEMKVQKNKTTGPSIQVRAPASPGPARNVKTTLTKPHITYCESLNPTSPEPLPDLGTKSKKHKSSKHETKERQSSERPKKRKKKSSPKKKKKTKTESPKKTAVNEVKTVAPIDVEIPYENLNRGQGPRTPPDNQVLTLNDEQVEWPSYLIRMTTTQPSISYSVNPDSVLDTNPASKPDTADLNADYSWYCNYFINSYEMDKNQAQHQASSTMISSGTYPDEVLNKWLEQRGFSKQSTENPLSDIYPILPPENDYQTSAGDKESLPRRPTKPKFTILKSQREIVLPDGTVLPAGTLQKIVHPYPRTERVAPEVLSAQYDLF